MEIGIQLHGIHVRPEQMLWCNTAAAWCPKEFLIVQSVISGVTIYVLILYRCENYFILEGKKKKILRDEYVFCFNNFKSFCSNFLSSLLINLFFNEYISKMCYNKLSSQVPCGVCFKNFIFINQFGQCSRNSQPQFKGVHITF